MKIKKVEKKINKEKRKDIINHRIREDYRGNDEKTTIEDFTGKMMT